MNMKLLSVAALVCTFLFIGDFVINAIEIEQDVYGEEISSPITGVTVTVENEFDEEVELYFEDENPLLMGLIKPKTSFKMNTYVGHSFFAAKLDNDDDDEKDEKELEILTEFQILPGQTVYTLPSSSSSSSSSSLASKHINTEIRTHPHPNVQYLDEGISTSVNARFKSLSSRILDLYYDGGRGQKGSLQAVLAMGQETSTASYEGHQFYYTPHDQPEVILGRHVVSKDVVLYTLSDSQYLASRAILEHTEKELNFISEYKNRTGLYWRSFYGKDGPRPPPVLYMWPAEQIGQVHKVTSKHGFWKCLGSKVDCQLNDTVALELEVISLQPRAFIIKNFLSHHECDVIINLAKPKLARSQVGEGGISTAVSETRSSTNTWINRYKTLETQAITLRAADLLQIDEKLLNSNTNAEDMQVVHYEVGQKYDPHHDWGVSGYPESRYITLLFYLTDMVNENAGGETSFPKAAGGRGVKVHPGKGSAVLFYNLLPDGNSDDLSLHEARPVKIGEKWLANYWVWDPMRND